MISQLQQQNPSGSKKNLRALQCVHDGTFGRTIFSPLGKIDPGFLRTRSDMTKKEKNNNKLLVTIDTENNSNKKKTKLRNITILAASTI